MMRNHRRIMSRSRESIRRPLPTCKMQAESDPPFPASANLPRNNSAYLGAMWWWRWQDVLHCAHLRLETSPALATSCNTRWGAFRMEMQKATLTSTCLADNFSRSKRRRPVGGLQGIQQPNHLRSILLPHPQNDWSTEANPSTRGSPYRNTIQQPPRVKGGSISNVPLGATHTSRFSAVHNNGGEKVGATPLD
jgi:hypothetical protein